MQRPTIDNTSAVFQAGTTIGTYLTSAIHEIDKRFEEGYARKHPKLVAECVRSQTLDFNGVALNAVLYEISDALGRIGDAVEKLQRED